MSASPSTPPPSNRDQCATILDQAEAHLRAMLASLEGSAANVPDPRPARAFGLRRRTTEAGI